MVGTAEQRVDEYENTASGSQLAERRRQLGRQESTYGKKSVGPFSFVTSTSGTKTFTLPQTQTMRQDSQPFNRAIRTSVRTNVMDESVPPTTDQKAMGHHGARPDDGEDLELFQPRMHGPLHSTTTLGRRCATVV